MMQALTVRDLARVLVAARVELLSAEATLNALNVFPVPDGDTGTNMRMTLEAGLDALGDADASDDERAGLRRVVAAMTRGAQGNSGVILSEYLRGFVREITSTKRLIPGARGLEVDGDTLAWALGSAATAARGAVHEPVEGTILSVAQHASRAANLLVDQAVHAGASVGVGPVTQVAFDAARKALERTPQQLEVLAHSNVVDAGAAGLVLVLEALARVAAGRDGLPRVSERSWLRPRHGGALHDVGGCHAVEGGPAFELICGVEGLDDADAASLRADLAALGDSVVVAGGDGVHRVHVHTDRVLAAVSSVRALGRTSRVTITRFDGALAALGEVAVSAQDEAVLAYARSLGARLWSPDGATRSAVDAGQHAVAKHGVAGSTEPSDVIVLSDSPEPPQAVTHHLFALLHGLEERGEGAALIDDFAGMDESGDDGSDLADPVFGDGFEDELDPDDVEVLRATSWRAARDLARLHLADAEVVMLCIDPDASREASTELLAIVREQAPSADVEVLRLSMGALVLMEVTHG